MGLQIGTDQLLGACRVTGATGDSTTTPAFRMGNITATARSGAGVYTVSMLGGIAADQAESLITLTIESIAPGVFGQFNWSSDTVLNVLTFTATAAAGDATAFGVQVRRTRILS